MPDKISIDEAKKIASNLLKIFNDLPEFKNVQINNVYPVYGVKGNEEEYYEIKFTSQAHADNGYAIVSATKKDLPVVEFSETGETNFEYFKKKLGNKNFKMRRFSPNYYSAEDNQGKNLADFGIKPIVIPSEMKKIIRKEGGNVRSNREYKEPNINKRSLKNNWRLFLSNIQISSHNILWADGRNNHAYYNQIPAETPPNDTSHWSGCGATAWMNLYGWHDLNWTD